METCRRDAVRRRAPTLLDLNTFTTLIFYSMGYKLFTLRQASRRSWRINQTAARVEVYLLYYRDTMQHKAIKLMASKLAVAGIIEGSFTEEGLAAMSDVQDMTSQMAKELMAGIRDNVEDIASSFKKMAVLKPARKETKAIAGPASVQEQPAPIIAAPTSRSPDPIRAAELEAMLQKKMEETQKRSKKPAADENQLCLFGSVA